MAIQFMLDILDHAPPMTAAEGLILLAIAEETRVPGEVRTIDVPTMTRRTRGMSPSGVRKAVERLAERGIEVRVPFGVNKRGEPQYAVMGQPPRYRLPSFPPPPGCSCARCERTGSQKAGPQSLLDKPLSRLGEDSQVAQGGTVVPPEVQGGTTVHRGGTVVSGGGTTVPLSGTTVPPYPSVAVKPPSLSAPERQAVTAVVSTVEEREDHQGEDQTPTVPGVPADLVRQVMAETEATAAEFVRVVEAARRAGVHSPGPWLLSKAGKANFRQRLDDLRAAPSATRPGPPGVGDYRQAIRAACDHGTPGGSARCALCRTQAPAQPCRDQAPTAGEEHSAEPPPTSGERDTAVARLRAQLADKRPPRATTPARFIPAAAEVPTAVTAAHTYLNSCGDGLEWVETAREKLGTDAPRDEVVVLAATLAHEHHDRIPVAR